MVISLRLKVLHTNATKKCRNQIIYKAQIQERSKETSKALYSKDVKCVAHIQIPIVNYRYNCHISQARRYTKSIYKTLPCLYHSRNKSLEKLLMGVKMRKAIRSILLLNTFVSISCCLRLFFFENLRVFEVLLNSKN